MYYVVYTLYLHKFYLVFTIRVKCVMSVHTLEVGEEISIQTIYTLEKNHEVQNLNHIMWNTNTLVGYQFYNQFSYRAKISYR